MFRSGFVINPFATMHSLEGPKVAYSPLHCLIMFSTEPSFRFAFDYISTHLNIINVFYM